jgi:hypothetical protein
VEHHHPLAVAVGLDRLAGGRQQPQVADVVRLHRHPKIGAAAAQLQDGAPGAFEGVAQLGSGQGHRALAIGRRPVVDLEQHVAWADAGGSGSAVRHHVDHGDPVAVADRARRAAHRATEHVGVGVGEAGGRAHLLGAHVERGIEQRIAETVDPGLAREQLAQRLDPLLPLLEPQEVGRHRVRRPARRRVRRRRHRRRQQCQRRHHRQGPYARVRNRSAHRSEP